jgi:GNAT superfamily N-acetyltransferase
VRAGEWERWREVRLAALRDSPEAFGSTYEQELDHPDDLWIERTAAGATSGERAFFIAEEGAHWIACAGGYRPEPDGVPAVISMWVAPEARGAGIARRLLDAVRDWAVETGAEALTLHVVSTQAPARALYEAYGFRYTGRREPGRRDASQVLLEMESKVSTSP